MTHDELWLTKYLEVKRFIETHHRNPSKYDSEERGRYVNWLRHNRKLMNAGELKPERVENLRKLLAMMEEVKRVNQYE
ncbi:MAG: helicase associated domain-containing protein [Bacteroidales bacterium]|nr:helicase associated domain-containing protein [Bacteroidales bacterium]